MRLVRDRTRDYFDVSYPPGSALILCMPGRECREPGKRARQGACSSTGEKRVARQPTVLVVDDQLGPQESLRAILLPEYQVLIAADGEQALQLLAQQPVDVVLLDLQMPGLQGLQVLERLRTRAPALPVIIVTAYGSADTVREGARLQAFAHIAKPFPIADLRETIKQALAHRS
jgi:DNA-binding NtrC family response regulator